MVVVIIVNVISYILQIDLPDTVSERYSHSLSSLMIGPHCVWLVVLGGRVNPEMRNVDGVDKYFSHFVSSPNISMLIELSEYQ